MKTLDELFNEITTTESDEFKEEFLTAVKDNEGLQAFLKKYDCQATAEEFQEYIQEKMQNNEEVSDEELESINGGIWWSLGAVSIATGIIGCIGHTIASFGKSIYDSEKNGKVHYANWETVGKMATCSD